MILAGKMQFQYIRLVVTSIVVINVTPTLLSLTQLSETIRNCVAKTGKQKLPAKLRQIELSDFSNEQIN
jgi:hypothetical protein